MTPNWHTAHPGSEIFGCLIAHLLFRSLDVLRFYPLKTTIINMVNWSEKAIEDTLNKYTERGEVLTREGAIEILDSLYALAEILIESYEQMKSDMSCEI